MATEKEPVSTAAAIQQKRGQEPLHVRIRKLREEAQAEPAAPASDREQLGIEDAAIRVATVASTAGKKDAERRTIFRDLRPGVTVTSEDTKTVTTKPSPRFVSMSDDELQEVNYDALSSADLEAYADELDRRTPERPASFEDDAEWDDLQLEDDDLQPGQALPWESWHEDNLGGNNGN